MNASTPAIIIPYLLTFLHYDCHFNPPLYLPCPTLICLFHFAFAFLISNYSACAEIQCFVLESVTLESLPFTQQPTFLFFPQGFLAKASNFFLPSNLSGHTKLKKLHMEDSMMASAGNNRGQKEQPFTFFM